VTDGEKSTEGEFEVSHEMLAAGERFSVAWEDEDPSLAVDTYRQLAQCIYLAMKRLEPTKVQPTRTRSPH